jgi:hypothetical protein
MTVIKRDQVDAPSMVREPVSMPSLKGDVIVRSRMLADSMAINTLQESIRTVVKGESEEDRLVRVGAMVVAKTLSLQVVLEDDSPLYTMEQWALHGAKHANEVLTLYGVCQRLSGADPGALAKNSQPSRTDASPSSSRTGWVARLKSLVGG